MHGFSEEWLADYQKRMASLKAPTKAPVAAPAPVKRKKPGNTATERHARVKRGVRLDIGPMHFRSAWEANYARYLNVMIRFGKILKWEYEPTTFWFNGIKRGTVSYLPDFKIWPITGEPYFVEVKGYLDGKSKTKLKRMRKFHPGVRVELVDAKAYQAIARTVRALIPAWEGGEFK